LEKLFGTDGVRGLANTELTPELAMQIGKAGAYVLAGHLGRPAKILIGTDTRQSSDMLEAALIAGLCSVGAEVHRARSIPSPAMAHLVRLYEMDAGVMLSASHNHMADNGIKFFDNAGYKLSDDVEAEIEALIKDDCNKVPRPTGGEVGRSQFRKEESVAHYIDFLSNIVEGNKPFEGLKVGLDCANGACYSAGPLVFEKLGAEVYPIHYEPNGTNINENCGSTHLESLQAHVKANKLDVGLAFDGDGDRVLCVDETGAELDGDGIMAICALALRERGKLKNNTIVATVMSNMGLELFCKKEGFELKRTKVGDRYVIQEMISGDYNLGGEQSGHIIYHDYNTVGDGILTGLLLIDSFRKSGQKLSELRKVIEVLPQVLLGAKLKKRVTTDVCKNEKIDKAIKEVEARLEGKGRVLVRASGTEPLIRVMIEGPDKAMLSKMAEELVDLISEEFS